MGSMAQSLLSAPNSFVFGWAKSQSLCIGARETKKERRSSRRFQFFSLQKKRWFLIPANKKRWHGGKHFIKPGNYCCIVFVSSIFPVVYLGIKVIPKDKVKNAEKNPVTHHESLATSPTYGLMIGDPNGGLRCYRLLAVYHRHKLTWRIMIHGTGIFTYIWLKFEVIM